MRRWAMILAICLLPPTIRRLHYSLAVPMDTYLYPFAQCSMSLFWIQKNLYFWMGSAGWDAAQIQNLYEKVYSAWGLMLIYPAGCLTI